MHDKLGAGVAYLGYAFAMPNDLYTHDILTWSAHQATLLRRMAAGERVNEAVDWRHLIEEIADVGLSELRACESLLRQAMLHLIKRHSGADQPAADWRADTVGFLADAAARFTPSMRQRIDMEALYARAVRQARAGGLPTADALPARCPWSLDALLSDSADIDRLLSAIR